jgi:hypothetical protein
LAQGSPESRRPGVVELVDADPRSFADKPDVPWPVRRGGWILAIYQHSLGLALFGLFALVLPGGKRVVNGRKVNPVPEDLLLPVVGDEVVLVLRGHPNQKSWKGAFTTLWGGNGLFLIRGPKIITGGRSNLTQSISAKGRDAFVEALRKGGGERETESESETFVGTDFAL